MRRWIWTLIATALLAGAAAADVPPDKTITPRPQTGKTGVPGPHNRAPIFGEVYIGERAPDFVLDGSKGTEEQLSRQRGKWVLLMFDDRYKSMAMYDTLAAEGLKLGARVIGVCHEKQQMITTATARDHVDMLLLADPTGEVSAVYGLYDWGDSKILPGFIVIDREGTVRLAVIGKLFPSAQMLELLKFATGTTLE